MKSIIATSLCLLFSVFLAASAHAEDIYEANYETYPSHLYSDVTDIINSDLVVRVGGIFTHYSYTVAKSDTDKKTLHYNGAGGNIALYYCKDLSCGVIDQNLSTVYTYKGSNNHFIGSTHIGYLIRYLLADIILLQGSIGAGLAYASNSDDIEKKVFIGNGVALSFKLSILATFFFTRDIGAGFHIAPSMLYEFGVNNNVNYENKNIFFGFDAGIHLILKY